MTISWRAFFVIAFVVAMLSLSGCGDGGGEVTVSAPAGSVVSGSAAKGPFKQGGKVEIFKVNKDGSLVTPATWKGTIASDDGKFSVNLGDYQGPVEIQISGSYLNEVTGGIGTSTDPLKCIAYVSGNTQANVNIITHLATEKIKSFMSKGYDANTAISLAYSEIGTILEDIIGDKSPQALQLLDLTVLENAKLLVLSYAFQKVGDNDTVKLLNLLAGNLKGENVLDWELTGEQKAELKSIGLTPVSDQLNTAIQALATDYTQVFDNLKNLPGFKGTLNDLKDLKIAIKSFSKLSALGLAKLAGTEVYVNLDQKPLGTEALALKEEGGKVVAELDSPDFTYGYVSTDKGKDAYIFVQPVDKNKTKLELPEKELICEACYEAITKTLASVEIPSGVEKPVPKTISSSDATTKVVVSNMKLKKDITVAVTPYKSNKFIPKFDSIASDTGLNNPVVISGADIKIVDALGKPTTAEKACFCANVYVETTHLLPGALTLDELKAKLQAGDGTLYLLVFKDKKWQIVDGAGFVISGKALSQSASKTLRLYPFVIVYAPKAGTAFSGQITGIVTEEDGKTPVKGALIKVEGKEIFAVTGADGSYTLPYSALKSQEPITYTLTFSKAGYSKVQDSVILSSSAPNVTKNAMLQKLQTFKLEGKVTDENQKSVPNAHLTLYYDSLEFDTFTDADGNYHFDLIPVDKKDALKLLAEAFGFAKSVKDVTGTIQDGKLTFNVVLEKKQVSAGFFGYFEGFETELKEKKWTIENSSPYVGWQVIEKPETIKVAPEIVDQILFPDRPTVDVTGKVASLFGVKGYGGTCTPYPTWATELPPSTGEVPAIPQNVQVTPQYASFVVSWDPVQDVPEYLVTVTDGVQSVSFFVPYTYTPFMVQSGIADWKEYTKTMSITNGKVYQVAVQSAKFKQPEGSYEGTDYYQLWVFSNYSDIKCVMPVQSNVVGVAFKKAEDQKETVLLVNGVDFDGDGIFDSLATDFSSYTTAQYQFEIQGPVALNKDVLVSYPDPANKNVALLPAYEGEHVLWYGNKETGTISDQKSSTSSQANKGTATSQLLDLTKFNNVTATMHTWFEVESVDVAKKQFDLMEIRVAIFDDDKQENEPITIVASGQEYTLQNQKFYTIVSLNPELEPPGMQKAFINYSSGGVNAAPIWVLKELNLTPFAGHKVKLQFSFDTKDSQYNGFRGWAIDKLSITDEKSSQPFIFEGYSQSYQGLEAIRLDRE